MNTVTIQEPGNVVLVKETVAYPPVTVVAQGPKGDPGDVNPLTIQANEQAQAAAASASTDAGIAATKAIEANSSANTALTAATTATAKANEAVTASTNAATSEAYAASSAQSASSYNASAQASAATALAAETAITSAQIAIADYSTAASDGASTATAKAIEATNSAADAAASATAALASKNAAATSETNALASKNSASTSATTATTKASEAATSATNAAASATTASTKATEASTSATNAAASATAAATSATNTANALVGERSAVATLTNKTITGGAANPAVLQEGGVDAVVQSDIGTGPNQIPLNQYLGPLAFGTDSPNLSGLLISGAAASRPVNGTGIYSYQFILPPEHKYSLGATANGVYFYGTFADDRIPAGGGTMYASGFNSTLNGYALDPVGRVALNGYNAIVRRNNPLDVGANGNPASFLTGFRSLVQHQSAIPPTVVTGQAIGASSAIACQSGTIVEATGFNSVMSMPAAGGTAAITNARGIYTNATVGAATGSQTIGSYYDAYLDGATVTGAGVVTNKFGVYQTKADHINYFAGDFLIGRASKVSGGKLEVAGNLVCQPSMAAPALGANGDMSFQLVSNTSLKILVRGSDGVTRSTTLTLA